MSSANNSLPQLFDLTSKTALLTGATAGMGLAMAKALGQAGAKLVICGNEANETTAAVTEMKNLSLIHI